MIPGVTGGGSSSTSGPEAEDGNNALSNILNPRQKRINHKEARNREIGIPITSPQPLRDRKTSTPILTTKRKGIRNMKPSRIVQNRWIALSFILPDRMLR
jgi:hypothetical protein